MQVRVPPLSPFPYSVAMVDVTQDMENGLKGRHWPVQPIRPLFHFLCYILTIATLHLRHCTLTVLPQVSNCNYAEFDPFFALRHSETRNRRRVGDFFPPF